MRRLLVFTVFAVVGWAQLSVPVLDISGSGVPAATCTVGQRYYQTDASAGSNIWTCTSTNVWTQGAKPTPAYGEMYYYVASSGTPYAMDINVVGQYQGFAITATGTVVSGWTAKAGTKGVVSAVADNNGVSPNTILVTTSAPHGLDVGDYVCHTGFTTRTTYQGKYKVLTVPLSTTYTVARAFQVSTDTGWFQRSWSLRANTGSAGLYRVSFTMSSQSVTGTTNYRLEVNQNATDLDSIAAQQEHVTKATSGAMSAIGLVTIADDDVIYMTVKNLTDATDFAIWMANLSLNRL